MVRSIASVARSMNTLWGVGASKSPVISALALMKNNEFASEYVKHLNDDSIPAWADQTGTFLLGREASERIGRVDSLLRKCNNTRALNRFQLNRAIGLQEDRNDLIDTHAYPALHIASHLSSVPAKIRSLRFSDWFGNPPRSEREKLIDEALQMYVEPLPSETDVTAWHKRYDRTADLFRRSGMSLETFPESIRAYVIGNYSAIFYPFTDEYYPHYSNWLLKGRGRKYYSSLPANEQRSLRNEYAFTEKQKKKLNR